MDYTAELVAIAKEHGGIIETKVASQKPCSTSCAKKIKSIAL